MAISLVAAGLAAAGTAAGLADTAKPVVSGWQIPAPVGTPKPVVSGWEIPALHNAASDRPLAYTPDCTGTSFQVCVHPVFSSFRGDVAAALDPVAAEVAGLPGAPLSAEEVAADRGKGALPGGVITGIPPAYEFNAERAGGLIGLFQGTAASASSATWRALFQQAFLDALVAGPSHAGFLGPTNPAQQAVVTALLAAVGSQVPQSHQAGRSGGPAGEPSPAQIAAAANRFAALPPAARHAWLAAHLPALRAGQITLAQLP